MSGFDESKLTFSNEEEEQINSIREIVKDKADYNLRTIIGFTQKVNQLVSTGEVDEYGCPVQDWDKLSIRQLTNLFAEGTALNFFNTPVRMQSFIESTLADVVYKYRFNIAITDPTLTGTVAAKNAAAEISTQDEKFAATFRELYTNYVTEVCRSFDTYLRRLEHIIDWRIKDEQINPGRKVVRKN